MTMKYDYLIVGSGLFGATFAYLAKKAGKKCLVIDKRPHLGGNVYCEKVEGMNVHQYGNNILNNNNQQQPNNNSVEKGSDNTSLNTKRKQIVVDIYKDAFNAKMSAVGLIYQSMLLLMRKHVASYKGSDGFGDNTKKK